LTSSRHTPHVGALPVSSMVMEEARQHNQGDSQ
jgi:hypothetical protein